MIITELPPSKFNIPRKILSSNSWAAPPRQGVCVGGPVHWLPRVRGGSDCLVDFHLWKGDAGDTHATMVECTWDYVGGTSPHHRHHRHHRHREGLWLWNGWFPSLFYAWGPGGRMRKASSEWFDGRYSKKMTHLQQSGHKNHRLTSLSWLVRIKHRQ